MYCKLKYVELRMSPGEPANLPEETFKVPPTNSLERICRKKLSKVLPTNSLGPTGNICGHQNGPEVGNALVPDDDWAELPVLPIDAENVSDFFAGMFCAQAVT